jgi:acetylornithine deacetylase/succinyl-diaminopimelate desuccinylase-like protein
MRIETRDANIPPMPSSTHDEAVGLLRQLLRLDTSNPPGNERPAQELVAGRLRDAGFEVVLVEPDPERPSVVGRLRGLRPGPVLGLLSHVDTVPASPRGWNHDPWSGALEEGCVWGRGAIDMKSQTAAEVVAACSLAREGWRPESGDPVVISVADEEVGGTGAEIVCSERPDLVRCDYLLNEGGGVSFALGDERLYDVSVAEKGVFHLTLLTDGVAGHASVPAVADNALLKLIPLLEALAAPAVGYDLTPAARALLAELEPGADGDTAVALERLRERAPDFAPLVEAMMQVTLAPTMAGASESRNVIPDEAHLHVDCRVPPGMTDPQVRARLQEVLPADGYRLEVTERIVGNGSPPESPLMDALRSWVGLADPGARVVPTISTGYTDSRTFRDAFPDCVAYGFFPQRHMSLRDVEALVHGRNERIDVRDLALAVDCYRSVAVELLG